MAFEIRYPHSLTGPEQQEAESTGCEDSVAPTNESCLVPPSQGFNAALSSLGNSYCFDRLAGSEIAGNAEHIWPTQIQAPISCDDFYANFVFPSTAQDSLPETDRSCFAVDHDSYVENSFVWPLKSPENILSERFLSSLACNDDYNVSEAATPRFYHNQGVESHSSYLNSIESESLILQAHENDLCETTLSSSMFCPQDANIPDVQLPEAQIERMQKLPRASKGGIVDLHLGEFGERRQIPRYAVESSPETSHLGGYHATDLSLVKECLSLMPNAPQGFSGASFVTPEASSGPNLTVPRFNDLLVNFDANVDAPPLKRKRKTFGVEDRKKVHAVRKTHACVSCRSRKISCSASGVCKYCLRTANDPLMAKQICLRTRLQDTFVGVKDIYGSLDARRSELEPIIGSMIGRPSQVFISVICSTDSDDCIAELPIEVRSCSTSPQDRWKSLGKVNGIYLTCDFAYDRRYVAVPSSLPSVDEVDKFGRKILSLSNGSHCGEITRRLDAFLLYYCCQEIKSPLRNFSDLTLRVVGLNGLVSYGYLNVRDGSYKLLARPPTPDSESQNFVSPTVYDQIRLIAAEGAKPAEESVFAEIDSLSKMIGSNKHARIVAGMCVLRLLLLYRDRAFRDEIRISLPRQKLRHRGRLEQSIFMYKRLAIAYGALCRESDSPVTMAYASEPGIEANSKDDRRLRTLFQQLQPAYKSFCENLTQKHDDVFKALAARFEKAITAAPRARYFP